MIALRLVIATIFLALTASLFGLFPPPSPANAQFVAQATYGGTSGGTANAQTITVANYAANTVGVPLTFTVGNTNTGPATLNVSSLGAVAVQRPSSIGNVALSGAELTAGELVQVTYTGSVYLITSNVDLSPIGRTVEFRGSSTPRGTLIEDGSAVSRTTYAALFSVIGTTYGSGDGSTTFNLPNSKGTMFAALDDQGTGGAAGRITSGGSGCTGTAVGFCGSQNQTLTLAQLPTGITSVNASQSITVSSTGPAGAQKLPNLATSVVGGGGVGISYNDGTNTGNISSSGTNSISTTSNNTSGSSHPVLNPILLGRRAIKY